MTVTRLGCKSCRFYIICLMWSLASAQLLHSGESGVSECLLQGRWEDEPVQVIIYLSACAQPHNRDKLHITGNFVFLDLQPVKTTQLQQVVSGRDWAQSPHALVLRSPHTDEVWDLHLQVQNAWNRNDSRRFPGHLSANITLGPQDTQFIEFEVRAGHAFHTFCSFMPLLAASRVPPWTSPQPTQQPAAHHTFTLPVCEWLLPSGDDPSPRQTAKESDLQNDNHFDNARPTHRKRHTYMIMSPFFGLSASDYVTLLGHHMRYHERLGADRYLVYVQEGVSALMADPRVQTWFEGGKLRLVVWNEPLLYIKLNYPHRNRHQYASQNLVYNHALLSLWHEDAVAVIADVDEYLLTPAKTTFDQVLQSCGGSDPAIASLQLPRRDGHCTGCVAAASNKANGNTNSTDKNSGGKKGAAASKIQDHAASQLNLAALNASHHLEHEMWMSAPGSSVQSFLSKAVGLPAHPVALYGVWTFGDPMPKSVVLPHLVAFTNPHMAFVVPGRRHAAAPLRCGYWLHLRTQMVFRAPSDGVFHDPRHVERNYMWVLEELAEEAQETTTSLQQPDVSPTRH